jgi:hypothetical protein
MLLHHSEIKWCMSWLLINITPWIIIQFIYNSVCQEQRSYDRQILINIYIKDEEIKNQMVDYRYSKKERGGGGEKGGKVKANYNKN